MQNYIFLALLIGIFVATGLVEEAPHIAGPLALALFTVASFMIRYNLKAESAKHENQK